jgi:hypothetical protein
MRSLFIFILMTTGAMAQAVQNNATVNIIGNNQSINIVQFGANHSVTINSTGNDIPVSVTQNSMTPKTFSIDIACAVACASSPYVIEQY